MTAVLAIQAFVFQDGGILALGANVFNLAIAGVLSAYLPYHFCGAGRFRKPPSLRARFCRSWSARILALSQILLSGVPVAMPLAAVVGRLIPVSAVIEGIITIAILQAIERINPDWMQRPGGEKPCPHDCRCVAVILACAGFVVASNRPDALGSCCRQLGSRRLRQPLQSPLADYKLAINSMSDLAKASAG